MFVDEVGEAHHAVFASCGSDQNQNSFKTGTQGQVLVLVLVPLTPQLHQLGQDDEAGLLSDRVREVHGALDDGEQNPLDVLRSWKGTQPWSHDGPTRERNRPRTQNPVLTLVGQHLVHAAPRHGLDEAEVAPPQHLLLQRRRLVVVLSGPSQNLEDGEDQRHEDLLQEGGDLPLQQEEQVRRRRPKVLVVGGACTLNLAVIWLMRGMNSCRSLASQSFSMCSEAAGTKGSTSSSRQMIIRCRKERTALRSAPRWTGQLSAGRKFCRQSR